MDFSSTGPSGELLGMPMIFTKTSKLENGFTVFSGTGGFLLFVISLDGALVWVIGTVIGVSTTIIMKNPETPVEGLIPTLGWLYLDGGEWIIDASLIVVMIPTGGNNS